VEIRSLKDLTQIAENAESVTERIRSLNVATLMFTFRTCLYRCLWRRRRHGLTLRSSVVGSR
jgi:hypothetical protein